MNYLTMKHMRHITGATAREIDYWESKGLVQPSGTRSGIRGWRGYTINDAILARAIKALRKDGVSLQKIEQVLKVISSEMNGTKQPNELMRMFKLVAYGGDVYIKTSTQEAFRAVDRQSTFLFVDMELIEIEVGEKLSQLNIKDPLRA